MEDKIKICKCGNEILDDGYDYDMCIGCHAKSMNLNIKVIGGDLTNETNKSKSWGL